MRVIILGPVYPYRGGIAAFTAHLHQAFIDARHTSQVFSYQRQYPAFLYPGKSDKDPSQDHPDIQAVYSLDPLYPWTWFSTAQAIKSTQADVVLIQWWVSFWAPANILLTWLIRKAGIPCVYVIHNVMPHEPRFYDRWLARFVLGQAQHCVVLSPQEESRLRSLLPRMDVFRSQLPVLRLSTREVSKAQARESLGISKDAVVLLFFGIIRPYKGLKILLEALGSLALQAIKPTLIIAGEFWEDEQGYRQQISRLNLVAQVFIDNRFVPNEVSALYYSAADYMTAPYIGGTQSSVLRAAMDYGLPIIASESIVSDLPQDHYPLFTHKVGDAEDLTRVLARVLSAPIPPAMRPKNSANLIDLVHWIETISPDNANG